MDTKELEKFCPRARVRLIDAVKSRCYAFALDDEGRAEFAPTADIIKGRVLTSEEKAQRAELYRRIEAAVAKAEDDPTSPSGYETFCESMAYTWFNCFAAIRFMEVNGYLPCGVRMLSRQPVDPAEPYDIFDPDCLRMASELDLPGLNLERVRDLLLASDDQELFRLILVAQMNELAQVLPSIFGQVNKADALLLPENLMSRRDDAVLQPLVEKIKRETWEDVEVLGWMYQFYNSEVKDAFFKSKTKETPATIGPATQLFTPDWIVRYMVDNSLGRLWMLNNPGSGLREHMDYYIEPDAAHEDFIGIESPEDITLCDPACGSGHILVYAFKLLRLIYLERGYREREIPSLILQKNLHGMEIDPRAAQIASLALAMCACKFDRRFFRREVVADIKVLEPVKFEEGDIASDGALAKRKKLVEALAHLDEVGSLLAPSEEDISALKEACAQASSDSLFGANAAENLKKALSTCESLSRRFDCVVANPPYMGSSSFGPFLSKWVKKNYPDVKSDLFSSFIVRIMRFADDHGEVGMMTPFVWMFIGSYEKLRTRIIDEKTLTSLIQLEYSGFAGATVPICTFTFHNIHVEGYEGGYVRLADFPGPAVQAPKALEAIKNPACGWFYRRNADAFKQIPGTPIAYWASDALLDAFKSGKQLSEIGKPRQGLATGENARFVREWWEVSNCQSYFDCSTIADSVESHKKWFPYNKGGDFRKWYGNNECVINWEDDGKAVRSFTGSVVRNPDYYFKPSITWSKISSGSIAFRYKPAGHIFDVAGTSVYSDEAQLKYLQGACNSSVVQLIASMLSPTLNFEVGQIATYPIFESDSLSADVIDQVESLRSISKFDWDSFETSWDFKRHHLV